LLFESNPYAEVPANSTITADVARFIERSQLHSIPEDAVHIGVRCILDGLGLFVCGSGDKSTKIQAELAAEMGGREEALLLGCGRLRVPAPYAARVLGTAGHADDWDDSQVSKDPDHVYGLLTHPTIPPLAASLVMAQKLEQVSGRDFILAFMTGVEVETKISEWMFSQHYKRGFHSSGTVGTFGALASAAKLLGLGGDQLRHGLGIAASFAAGIRCNFGTMTKPLHVGRAAENGVMAALMASKGYRADRNALDGPWGFFAVLGGGVCESKIGQGFGRTWSILDPGISVKPYPCGVLAHPTIDLMLRLVTKHDIRPEDIEFVAVHAGSNILNPLRYPVAKDHLQAKFSLPALLAMVALRRKVGKAEFDDAFIRADEMQAMQRHIQTHHSPEMDSLGFDKMRSRIDIQLRAGRKVSGEANEAYRGGPDNPMSHAELEAKVRDCSAGALPAESIGKLIKAVWSILDLDDAQVLAQLIQTGW
jgi:2-methylcitrate dehydratase PrpD